MRNQQLTFQQKQLLTQATQAINPKAWCFSPRLDASFGSAGHGENQGPTRSRVPRVAPFVGLAWASGASMTFPGTREENI